MRMRAWVGLALLSFTTAPWAATGEYWEMSNKVEMEGMAMPAMSRKICLAKGAEKDPRQTADKECEVSDVKSSGNKFSWKMRCVKEGEVMTGNGEMSTFTDRTEGKVSFSSNKMGNMTMSFVNKRLGNACDLDEGKKRMDAAIDASNKNTALVCENYKRDLGRDLAKYFELKVSPWAKTCGIDMAAVKPTLCKSVDANNADFRKQMGDSNDRYTSEVQSECPREMKTYMEVTRKRMCEGRSFTAKQRVSMADCLKGVNDSGDDSDGADTQATTGSSAGKAPTQQAGKDAGNGIKLPGGISLPSLPGGGSGGAPADALIDGAKKLKNLFGL